MKTTKKLLTVFLAAILCASCLVSAAALYDPHAHTDGKIEDILSTVMKAAQEDEKILIRCVWPARELLDARGMDDATRSAEYDRIFENETPAIFAALPEGLGDGTGDDVNVWMMWRYPYVDIFDCFIIETRATKAQIEQIAALDGISEIDYQGYDARVSRFGRIDEEVRTVMDFAADEDTFFLSMWILYDEEFDATKWSPQNKEELQGLTIDEVDQWLLTKRDALKAFHTANNQAFLDALPAELRAGMLDVEYLNYAPIIDFRADRATIEALAQLDHVDRIYLGSAYIHWVEESDGVTHDGDLNGDGRVNAADARTALRSAAKLEALDRVQTYLGDMNKNGGVDSADARKILRIAARLETAGE